MRKIIGWCAILIGVVLLVAGCGKGVVKLTANDIMNKFVEADFGIDTYVVYTEDSDTNGLMGLDGQYISKVNFADNSLEQDESGDLLGGSIEVFDNKDDLNDRVVWLKAAFRKMPIFTEELVVNGNYLLRLSGKLDSELTNKYTEFFKRIK